MKKFFVLAALFLVAAFSAWKLVPRSGQHHPSQTAVTASGAAAETAKPPETTSPARRGASLKIYTVAANGPADSNGLAAQSVTVPASSHPARDAINALIAADTSPLPSGTSLRNVTVKDGLATVDFSSDFKKNFHGSDTQEAQTINAILLTLGQFSTISRVQLNVDGAPIDSLGGHLDISAPLDVIRPEPSKQVAANRG